MPYTTRVNGGFEIRPPIRWAEIKASPFTFHHATEAGAVATWRAPGIDLDLIVDTAEQDTEDGEAVIVTHAGVKLVMRQIDEYRADGLVEQVQRVIDMFDDDHAYEGRLEAEGEGGGWGLDVWRLLVDEGKAKKIVAHLSWPDEEGDAMRCLLLELADEINALPQDHELDPGRGECADKLRERAEEL